MSNIDVHYVGKVMYDTDIVNALNSVQPPVDTADEVLALRMAYMRMRYLFMSVDNHMTVVLIEPETERIISNRHASVGLQTFYRARYDNPRQYMDWKSRLFENASAKRLIREQAQSYESPSTSVTYAQYLPAVGRRGKGVLMLVYFDADQFLENDVFMLGERDYLYLQAKDGDQTQLAVLTGARCEAAPIADGAAGRMPEGAIVIRSASSANALQLTAVVQIRDALRPFIQLRLYVYALLASVTCVNLALSALFARRDAKPLQPVFSLVSAHNTSPAHYADVMRAVLGAVSSANSLQEAMENQNAMLRDVLLEQLLLNHQIDKTDLLQLSQRCALTFDSPALAVFLAAPADGTARAELSLLAHERLASVLGESAYLHDMPSSGIAAILKLDHVQDQQALRDVCVCAADALRGLEGAQYRVGTSEIGESAESLPVLFAHACYALEDAAQRQHTVCFYQRPASIYQYYYSPNQQVRMTSMLRAGDAEGVGDLLSDIYDGNSMRHADSPSPLLVSELLGTVFKAVGDMDLNVLSEVTREALAQISQDLEVGRLVIDFSGVRQICLMVASDAGACGMRAAFSQARAYIDVHYADPQLGMPHIERLLSLSASSVKRLFNEESGLGLSHYIEEVRMQKACKLLAEDDLSVGRIADAVGYLSLTSFSRAFKRVYGVSPLQYRLTHKSGKRGGL